VAPPRPTRRATSGPAPGPASPRRRCPRPSKNLVQSIYRYCKVSLP
jgi:hypothetical protein